MRKNAGPRLERAHLWERVSFATIASKIPGERALDGVGLRMRGELALVEGAEFHPWTETPVDQRRIARDRNARNRERSPGALEGERRSRRHIAERMLPLQGPARDQHGGIGKRQRGGNAHAEP